MPKSLFPAMLLAIRSFTRQKISAFRPNARIAHRTTLQMMVGVFLGSVVILV